MSNDEDGLDWAIETANQIVAKRYSGMAVTYSHDGEYVNSVDILPPQTFTTDPPMDWRVAKSLLTLRDQVDVKWPNRSKANDGTIGDEAHQATTSDHNPDDEGVVRAMDITLDLVEGERFAEALRLSRDPRIKYVIHNGRIFNSTVSPWIWRDRNKGPGDHTEHVHISVVKDDALADDTRPWKLDGVEPIGDTKSGKGSWYSQYSGKYEWVDTRDAPNSAALGIPDDAQGVAFYNHDTLGKWFMVYAPNGANSVEQQTDIGPHPSTGRLIDISAAAAERFGYSPKNFPTDSIFKWRPIPAPVSGMPQEQAVKFRDLRDQPMPPPSASVDAAMARLNDVVAEVKDQERRILALEQHKMPDTNTQPPQVDWSAILKPILEALLPLLPRLLPQLLPALVPLIIPLLTQWLTGRAPVAFVQTKADLPIGSIITLVLGGLSTVLSGVAASKGWLSPEAAAAAMGGSGVTAVAGGVSAASAVMAKPKA